MVFLIRLFLRLQISGPLGWDDAACGAATIFGISWSSVILLAVHHGLGQPQETLTAIDVAESYVLFWISRQFYALATGCSILSVTFFIMRITQTRHHLWILKTLIIVEGIWVLITVFILAFSCGADRPWDSKQGGCVDLWSVWLSHTVIYMFFEGLNFKTAMLIIWNLQMPLHPKVVVFISFALRLLVLPPAIVRLKYVHIAISSPDLTLYRVNSNLLSTIVLHVSIILATVPCAKPFFALFSNNLFRSPKQTTAVGGNGPLPPTPSPTPSRSLEDLRVPHRQSLTWDRRRSFAAASLHSPAPPLPTTGSAPRRKSVTFKLNLPPFHWNRRTSFARTRQVTKSSGLNLPTIPSADATPEPSLPSEPTELNTYPSNRPVFRKAGQSPSSSPSAETSITNTTSRSYHSSASVSQSPSQSPSAPATPQLHRHLPQHNHLHQLSSSALPSPAISTAASTSASTSAATSQYTATTRTTSKSQSRSPANSPPSTPGGTKEKPRKKKRRRVPRRPSDLDWIANLRPDEGRTITTIHAGRAGSECSPAGDVDEASGRRSGKATKTLAKLGGKAKARDGDGDAEGCGLGSMGGWEGFGVIERKEEFGFFYDDEGEDKSGGAAKASDERRGEEPLREERVAA
ncbi:hypothetical protein TI39_contig304g00009 [Zymoseptoria brevis]|uniref:Rhodopsin domain-containing protein n=1 Tax=Zymoseptoria brevis TaxID=1047168 RepID=A0A0F4GVJ2_9PEZI|nr:hypothetical protein TI39_contig304g00009 [Zymoseptoria brevis]